MPTIMFTIMIIMAAITTIIMMIITILTTIPQGAQKEILIIHALESLNLAIIARM